MAKRSDFAQKLLDDLRLRKERMAAAQSSSHSNSFAGDAHGYSQQSFRKSGELKSHGTVGSRTGKIKKNTTGEPSTQMVPFGKSRNSEPMGDLSRALAFALQNGGNLRKMESSGFTGSVLSFLHRIGRKASSELRKPERANSFDSRRGSSTPHFPSIAHLQVEEISKGAQKLNQILRACSGGVNFDKYSIEIGKELLRGAVDLEESLRMLVNLQDASEYMIGPRRKSKVRLIEVDGDEDDDAAVVADEKQLDLPRFSFDKPARISHRRSASAASSIKAPSESKSEIGRIPNVIARLMGLEELPEKVESRSKHGDSYSRPWMDATVSKKSASAELKMSSSENLALQRMNHEKPKQITVSYVQENGRHKSETKESSFKDETMKVQTDRRNAKRVTTKEKGRESLSRMSSKPIHVAVDLPKQQPQTDRITCSNKRSPTNPTAKSVLKGSPNKRFEQEDVAGKGSFGNIAPNKRFEQNASPKAKAHDPRAVEKKPTRVPSTKKKVDDKKVHKREIPKAANVPTAPKIRIVRNFAKPLKSNLHDPKQRRHDKAGDSIGAEREIDRARTKAATKFDESESIQSLNMGERFQKQDGQSRAIGDECQSLNASHASTSDNSCENITSGDPKDKQGQETISCRDQELKIDITVDPLNGTREGSVELSYPSKPANHSPKLGKLEPLTENENNLKQILAKSRVFLDTAEALFNLNIPVGILHASENNRQYEDSKLILDCSYEVMKRKGKQLEVSIHPSCIKTATGFPGKVGSLDELVKQLHRDIENLRFYGLDGKGEYDDDSDYLYKILEKDVKNKDPDVNCMWDLGWNETMFALIEKDQVIRDVEKHMLNGLLDEIATEFLLVSV